MLRIFKGAHFNFVGKRKYTYIISIILFISCLTTLILLWNNRQGIDFTGGTIIRLTVIEGDLSTSEIRKSIGSMGIGRSIIQESRGEEGKKGYLIRLPLVDDRVHEVDRIKEVDSSKIEFFENYNRAGGQFSVYLKTDSVLSIEEIAENNALTIKGKFLKDDSTVYYMMIGEYLDSLKGLEIIEFPEKIQIATPLMPVNIIKEQTDSFNLTDIIFVNDIINENTVIRLLVNKDEWVEIEKEFLPNFEDLEIVSSLDMEIKEQIENDFPSVVVNIDGSEHVGARISKSLKWRALWVVFLGIAVILVYITFRFTYRFGVSAIIALVHDVLITAGIYALSGFEFNITTIAGILTIIGYSINDSIVISDRIREVNRLNKGQDFAFIVNKSINATLGRTIITSITTLIVLISLFIFGSDIIKDFAFILIVGVIVGTYSSIAIVSPLVVDWEKKFPTPPGKSRA